MIIAADIEVAPSRFVFVEAGHFRERHRPSTVIVNKTTVINQTVNITRIKRVDKTINSSRHGVMVNEGPRADMIEKATGRKISATPIQDVVQRTPQPTPEGEAPPARVLDLKRERELPPAAGVAPGKNAPAMKENEKETRKEERQKQKEQRKEDKQDRRDGE